MGKNEELRWLDISQLLIYTGLHKGPQIISVVYKGCMRMLGELRLTVTLLVVGETALACVGELLAFFFFLILIPGTGAEFKASKKPVHSIAADGRREAKREHAFKIHYWPAGCCGRQEGDDLNIIWLIN